MFGIASLAFLWYFKGAYHAEQFAFAEFILLMLFVSAVYGLLRVRSFVANSTISFFGP
jgi:hypothetical protein